MISVLIYSISQWQEIPLEEYSKESNIVEIWKIEIENKRKWKKRVYDARICKTTTSLWENRTHDLRVICTMLYPAELIKSIRHKNCFLYQWIITNRIWENSKYKSSFELQSCRAFVTALGTGVSTARLFDCAANSIAKQYQFYTTLK